jgi:hypothetical protein
MSCRRHCGYGRLRHRPTRYWGILKWPSLGEFGWPPGRQPIAAARSGADARDMAQSRDADDARLRLDSEVSTADRF